VPELERIRRDHVLAAVRELATAGAAVSPDGGTTHRLVRGEHEYDVTGVVDLAHELATGDLSYRDGTPSPVDCALLLRGLGFEVTGEGLPPPRFTNAATVGAEHSRATWALAARERLLEVAAVYGEAIGYHDLAAFVQRRSLVRTTAHPRTWVGDVLARVAADCHRRGEPLLTSLVVDGRGKVGASYATALAALRGEEAVDVDAQAAQERLDCHRHFGAELPAGGGRPVVLAPAPAPRRTSSPPTSSTPQRGGARTARPATPRRTKAVGRRTAEESVAAAGASQTRTCPVHFTVIPASGVCDYCD
jgi:hypothetical protein